MSALLDALLPALAQVERERAVVEHSGGDRRKRRWREDPGNRAAENARRRERARERKARTHRRDK